MKESRIIECTMFNFPVAPGEYFLSYFLIHGCEFIDGLHNVERLYVRLGPLFGKNIYPQPEDGTVLLDGEWKLC
ncbi:MAG: hypothetical protein NTW13_02010 [Candidatus Omnitrophica bacterium]|nr:hypothetical protein [Candidatus Omnitrophota bacterium]